MRSLSLVVGVAVAVACAAGSAAAATPSAGATAISPAATAPATGRALPAEYRDRDLRPGSARHTAAAGPLGTTAAIGSGPAPLATGLSTDPETAARQYLSGNTRLFGPKSTLDTVAVLPVGAGSVVVLRQRYGSLPAGNDGLAAVAVKSGSVYRATSSLSPRLTTPPPATLTRERALAIALADAHIARSDLAVHRVRAVALPMPGADPVAAFEIVLGSKSHPLAYTSYVDGRTGAVLVRHNLVDFAGDNPSWKAFGAAPATSTDPATDDRQTWCARPAEGCDGSFADPAAGLAWDLDHASGAPTNTTSGNAADTQVRWGGTYPAQHATPSPSRDYAYPFTRQWTGSRCDPAALDSPARADADAATANLFAQHNRLHDWAYHLGFTEAAWNLQAVNHTGQGTGGDPQLGNAQQGAADLVNRNNANQSTYPDGISPVTNMYLWQPIAGREYVPCVDGDFDTSLIAHEYAHAISNRMIAGPDGILTSAQGSSMGESWSDLIAAEYQSEYHLSGSPTVIASYTTGDTTAGIRNYDLAHSPLNFSDVGYDGIWAIHSDGEIWSAANWDIRTAFLARYPAAGPAVDLDCAEGRRPVEQCPGNRRWIQLVLDSFLLQADGEVSMPTMRDNLIAADELRFGGADTDLLWTAFARRGLGAGAASRPTDFDPVPSFATPTGENAEVTFAPLGDGAGRPARLYVGDYQGGASPVADTDPATALPATVRMAPGTYRFLAVGKGLGHERFTLTVPPGGTVDAAVDMPANLASASRGATATGGSGALIDDDEDTVWLSPPTGAVNQKVTVDLPGEAPQRVARVQLSARGTPLRGIRQFEILTCDSTGADCSRDENYQSVLTSAPDAFPGGAYYPKTPALALRSFTVRPTDATHVRLRILATQCTGNPLYAGEQDSDPRTTTDCASTREGSQAHAAEFQVFGS
ncbi:MAG: peptidase m36 fungalysin [Actinomycetia bacterium]|nr:peptidase m36 fungalysin [Actinomycetes bacterium]